MMWQVKLVLEQGELPDPDTLSALRYQLEKREEGTVSHCLATDTQHAYNQ